MREHHLLLEDDAGGGGDNQTNLWVGSLPENADDMWLQSRKIIRIATEGYNLIIIRAVGVARLYVWDPDPACLRLPDISPVPPRHRICLARRITCLARHIISLGGAGDMSGMVRGCVWEVLGGRGLAPRHIRRHLHVAG